MRVKNRHSDVNETFNVIVSSSPKVIQKTSLVLSVFEKCSINVYGPIELHNACGAEVFNVPLVDHWYWRQHRCMCVDPKALVPEWTG